MRELEIYKWAVENSLFPKADIIPGPIDHQDVYLRKVRRIIEDHLRKDKTLIIPIAQLLGIWEERKRRRARKGGRDELH